MRMATWAAALLTLLSASFAIAQTGAKPGPTDKTQTARGEFRASGTAHRFDVSRPLREILASAPPTFQFNFVGDLMTDPDPATPPSGPQDQDGSVQSSFGGATVPGPLANFNVGVGTANPPDPVGDVGPNHYIRMANASFQIYNKMGTALTNSVAINTLFTGFGADCELENAGDPIVLYDQLADRWLLTQFSNSTGPNFFNCVALSQTGDPLGSYYRWSFATATFPDYPKYGIWPNAVLISTREVNAGLIGAYAIDRAAMLAGNPTPTVVEFTVPVNAFSGDGLLPADLDGIRLPPLNSPAFFIGSMDNGGQYGATQDALSLWAFNINFGAPTASSFTLAATIPIAPYDTIYPCSGRSCIAQPAPLGAVDILSYRQRPMNRAAYRNYGSYQSIVTNQSVEAAPLIAGVRWWEVRNPGRNAVLYQDSTFAPGVNDGINRWMASVAQDSSGNLGMGYSVSSATEFPGIRYTGRLESDPLNTMQTEGTFLAGVGGSSQATRRWGDYNSMNIDPTDDCTFWYINQFFATTGTQWTLRAGSFKFPDCGQPNFGIGAVPLTQTACVTDNVVINVDSHGYNDFSGGATLSVLGLPPGATATFSPSNLATVPGTTRITIRNPMTTTVGSYPLTVSAVGGTPQRTRTRPVTMQLQTAGCNALDRLFTDGFE